MKGKRIIAVLAACVLAVAAAGTALAETVRPNPGKIDIQDLGGRFITTDIEYKGNGMADLTLLENEQFDAEAVKAIQPGDVICSDGEEIKVESLEWDGPDLFINRGTAQEMLLCDNGHGFYERWMEDDRVPQLTVGTITCEILPYMMLLDWVDPVSGELLENLALRSGEDLLTLLERADGPSFAVENVRVLYDDNSQPVLFWRYYSPAQ